jgi:hypothetical protein
MLTKIGLISMLFSFLSVDLNKCKNNPGENEMTVVGTALVLKHTAAVRTDDSILYILDGIDDWKDKYLGKRVKVAGELVIKKYEYTEGNDSIKILTQERRGTWRIIEKPKWSLVK